MRAKITSVLSLLLFLFVSSVSAQQVNVSGVVTSGEDGLPLPGVSVIVVGTTTGTATDFDGNFAIPAQVGQELEFSFIGFANQKIAVTGSSMNVVLQPDAKALEEVIVVGYGTTTRKSFTGTAVQLEAENLEVKNTANISQALAGETAGVTVINTSGQPGTTSTVRIRGYGSINGNRDPLYVVDGVPFSGDINSINPADIASTTVLKDATATSIYGSRGANGVIVINTKKGKSGKSQIDLDVKIGTNVRQLPQYSRTTNQEEFVEITWEGMKNYAEITGEADPAAWASANVFGSEGLAEHYNMWDQPGNQLIDPATGKFNSGISRTYTPEAWSDVLFQSSQRIESNLRLSGGDNNTTYSTSFGFLDDKGYYWKSDYKRYSTRMDVGHQVKDWLKGSMNIGYTYSEMSNLGQTTDSNSGFWFADNIPTIYPVYLRQPGGEYVIDPIFGGYMYDYGDNGATDPEIRNRRGFGALTNAAGNMAYDLDKTYNHEVNGNAYLEAKFTDNLKAFTRLGLQFLERRRDNRGNPFYGGSAPNGGSIYKQFRRWTTINFLQGITYDNQFGDHGVTASLFHESNDWTYNYLSTYKTNLVDPFGTENNNAVVNQPSASYTRESMIESYFGKIDYNYLSKYHANFTMRRDGSSRFLNNKWGTFWSAGLGWIATEEAFLQDISWLNYMKVKASYGLTGDQAGADFYSGYDLYSIANLNDEPSLAFDTKGNPDLTWETSKQFQIGTELTLFNGVLDAQLDYYIKDTEDQFFERRVGPSLGYALLKVNDGSLRNSGFEFNLTGHIVKTTDFNLDLSVNGEMLNNELTAMPIDPATGVQKILDIDAPYGRSVGHSIFDFYMREFAGVDPQEGTSRWNLYYDDMDDSGDYTEGEAIASMTEYLAANPDANVQMTETSNYSEATQKYVGKSAIPTVRGAFRLNAGWKGLEVSAQFLYQFGGYAVDYQYRNLMANNTAGQNLWHTDIRDRWQQPGDITDVPRLSNEYDRNVNSTSTRFLTSTDMLAFNNLSVNYNFPKSVTNKLGLGRLSVFFTGDNLFLLSQRKGYNPMISETGASSSYDYQPLTTYTGGLRLSF